MDAGLASLGTLGSDVSSLTDDGTTITDDEAERHAASASKLAELAKYI